MLIRNKNNNIVVAKGHGYTVEKVKAALKFINSTGRNTKVQEWVEMYNYLKNASDKVEGCKPCAAAKYTASVRNYAKYGYLTLLNEGHKPEEFGIGEKKTQEPIENKEKRIVLTSDSEVIEKQGEEKPLIDIDGILTATNYDKMFQNCKSDAVIENVKDALQEEPNKVEEPQEEATEEPNKVEEVVEESKSKRGRKSSK